MTGRLACVSQRNCSRQEDELLGLWKPKGQHPNSRRMLFRKFSYFSSTARSIKVYVIFSSPPHISFSNVLIP